MRPQSDPAVWLIVAAVACAHGTYVLWRRSRTSFQWKGVGVGLAMWISLFIFCVGCVPTEAPVTAPAQVSWLAMVALFCGILLAGRSPTLPQQIGYSMLGIVVGIGLEGFTHELATSDDYMIGRAAWSMGDFNRFQTAIIEYSQVEGITTLPAGYLDSAPRK